MQSRGDLTPYSYSFKPKLEFSVTLTPTAMMITVPSEFLLPATEYKFEVLAIEASGNQTLSESTFTTP